jgi:TPP-dependent pyruvate/acetoin dehydrogenase alpha subunit
MGEAIDRRQNPRIGDRCYDAGFRTAATPGAARRMLSGSVLAGRGGRLALRWIGRDDAIRDFSYTELRARSNRFANVLAQQGIANGDRVCSLLGRCPELYLAALGTLKRQRVLAAVFGVRTRADQSAKDRATNFYGGNAIVGGGLPLAIGLALADHMRGENVVTACFFGDGAVAEGEFHESLNLAGLWSLPVLFVCENNLYGMGTALAIAESETDIHLKAQSYRMTAEAVDGMDVIAVEGAARRAIHAIRETPKPYFLECLAALVARR